MLSEAFHLLMELNPTKSALEINAQDPEAEAIVREFLVRQIIGLCKEFGTHSIWTDGEIRALLLDRARGIYKRAAEYYPSRIYREREDRPFAMKYEKYVLPTFKDVTKGDDSE